jgi:hypothetical protein
MFRKEGPLQVAGAAKVFPWVFCWDISENEPLEGAFRKVIVCRCSTHVMGMTTSSPQDFITNIPNFQTLFHSELPNVPHQI